MITPTRMHPMKVFSSLIKIVKENIFFVLILFIFNFGFDVATYIQVLRVLFLVYIAGHLINAVLSWWKTTYEIREGTVHVRSGVFKRKHNTIPLSEIQNITWDTPVYFRPFHVTSLRLETSAASDSASVKLDAIHTKEAKAVEELATTSGAEEDHHVQSEENEINEPESELDQIKAAQIKTDKPVTTERNVHFTPTKKDLVKASFLSFSFLALIPVLFIGYGNLENVIDIDKQAEGVYNFVAGSWIIATIVIILLIIAFVTFGIISTFLKYGKYEISSDDERIFIHRGILSEKAFSIRKANVQAIQITQTPPKKLLSLAEVKLISAGSMDGGSQDISTLFPFLPLARANSLIEELMPHLPMHKTMLKLPKQALLRRMLGVPWIGLIAAAAVLWFKIEWWLVIIPLFIFIYTARYFNYRNTRYKWDEKGIHFKSGGIWTEHFITNRKKVIEIEIEQGLLQRKLGLATITTVNRVKPVHHEHLADIPLEAAHNFKQWYVQRFDNQEIHVE